MQADEIYKDWLDNLRGDAKEFGQWRADDIDNVGALDYHYNQFLTDLAASLEENGVANPFKWLAKAEKEVDRVKTRIANKYSIPTDESKSAVARDGNLFGYPIIDPANVSPKAQRRKQLFPNLASIVDHINDVPYPEGIEEVSSDGRIIGYFLWVEK